MSRKIKAFGLALGAMLTIGAMSASAAQAVPTFKGIETEGATEKAVTTYITGEQEAVSNKLQFHETNAKGEIEPGHTVECEEAKFKGHLLTGSSTILTVIPTFGPKTAKGCEASGLPSTVEEEGCFFRFKELTKVEETMKYTSKADLLCTPGKDISVRAYLDEKHTTELCKLTVTEEDNQNLGGGEGEEITSEVITTKPTELTVSFKVKVNYHKSGTCGTATSDALYTGKVRLKAYKNALHTEQIDLDIGG